MILFLEDWAKYPTAIPNVKTTNKSWLRLAGLLKSMGVKNHAFPLALHNPDLIGIDPYSKTLTRSQMLNIVMEAGENPWFFFREIVKLNTSGGMPGMFEANRLNIALWWLFFNHITTLGIACRQIGKSTAIWALDTYILEVSGTHTNIHLLTKDDDLRTKSIADLKLIMESLPYYMKLRNKKDTYNTEKITVEQLGNTYYTSVARSSEADAAKIGRGYTIPCHRIDEFAFIKNIEISLSSLLPSATKAREAAKKNNGFYGNIYTTTAGYLSTKEGAYAYKVYNECLKFRETLYDCKDEEDLNNVIKKNSPKGKMQVLCEYNHRQLGKTDQWLMDNINMAMVEGERAEAEYLNIWSQGNAASPISKEMLEIISNSVIKDPRVTVSKQGYIINWYVDEISSRTKPLVIGLDTSDAIGNDDIAMIGRDAYTGEVLCSGLFNETNILTFSEFLVDLLVDYSNINILIIERKSTGSSIIDALLKMLPLKGIDPFKKLFNWVVHNALENKNYMEEVIKKNLNNRSEETYIKYKKEFGYATSASGRSSRDNLYGSAFTAAVKYSGKYVRDEVLFRQLSGLVKRNGRIDHRPDEHDDVCFTGDMLIRTINGNKPIKEIKLGDLVLTREGYKPVITIYKRKAKVITKFGITGTPSHPFITPSGIVEFKNLTNKSEVYVWRNGKLLSTMAKNITDIQNLREDISEFTTGNMIRTKNHQLHCTDRSGWIIMAKYRQVITSIIKMATQKITQSKIWNVFLQKIMLKNILCQKKKGKEQEKEGLETINLPSGKKRIQNLQKNYMKKMVERVLSILKLGKPVTKTCPVKYIPAPEKKQLKCTRSLEKKMEKNCSNGIDLTQSYQNLRKLKQSKLYKKNELEKNVEEYVYNLTIADCHEYFVNDVLVHNCIAWMLGWWVLSSSNNLSYYGLNTKMVLSGVTNEIMEEQGGLENIIDQENQQYLMNEIYTLLDKIRAERNPLITTSLVNRVKHLSKDIDDKYKVNFNLDAILEEIKLKKRKYFVNN